MWNSKTHSSQAPFLQSTFLLLLPFPPSEIWDYFHNTLLKKYASIYNSINVVTGPIFDYNYDGQYDTPEQIQQ